MNQTLIVVLTLALAGCGGIVRKPEIDSVKKIGIISVYSNPKLHYLKNNKVTEVDSPWDAATSALKMGNGLKAAFDSHSSPLLDYARKTLEAEFGKFARFQVVPFEQFSEKPAYKTFRTNTGKPMFQNKNISIGSMISQPSLNYDVAPGTRAVEGLWKVPVDHNRLAELGNLANELDLDGVIVARFDVGYRDPMFMSFSLQVGGANASKAEASTAGTLVLVTKQKAYGIIFPDFKDGEGSRNASSKRFQLINGRPVPNDEMTEALKESVLKTIQEFRQKLSGAL